MQNQILAIPEEATTGSRLFQVSNKFAWEVLLWAKRKSHVCDLVSDADLFEEFPLETTIPPRKMVIDEIKVLFELVSEEGVSLRKSEKCPTARGIQGALKRKSASTGEYSLLCESVPVGVIPNETLLLYWNAENDTLEDGSRQLMAWKRKILDTKAEQWKYHREQEYIESQLEAMEEERLAAQKTELEEQERYLEIMEDLKSPPSIKIGFQSSRHSD